MRIGDRVLYMGEPVWIVEAYASKLVGWFRIEHPDGTRKWVRLKDLERIPEEARR